MSPRIGISMFSGREQLRVYTKVQTNYPSSVHAAGGLPLLLPTPGGPNETERAEEAVATLDGLVLTGGEDMNPLVYRDEPLAELGTTDIARDRWELALVSAAEKKGIPVLGICRGIQVVNVARGGTLYQDIHAQTESRQSHFPRTMPMESLHHTVSVEPGSLMARIFETERLTVNSFHHQAVKDMGRDLIVTSRAVDGIIEAVEDPSLPFFLAVQFHAEALPPLDAYYLRIFEALVEAAGKMRS